MAEFRDIYWWSSDGLRLHARDYPGADDTPPVLCLPGLTRNARDFADVARSIAPARRVIAVEFRGRGESGYAKDPMSYVPLTYAQDVVALLDDQKIDRFVTIGTSLGGIVTMLLAGLVPGRLAGALLNDVGPEIEPAGLARIRGYVGKPSTWPTWMHAARGVQEGNAAAYPDWGIEQWLAMAKRLYRVNSAGRIVLDYDMKIAEPFRLPGNEAGPDMWRALAALAGVPVLVVRGALSDILSARTAERMVATLPDATLVTVPEIGHAPMLDEPAVQPALRHWLARTGNRPAD
ncbi:pimeloyl-ACP methyl ester carboxylesterase [Sphingomonas endophytica]|uniref:Pimeloyl-ACP methyl ester carboxylesterase n=1 Tax=Sphingomonas endophytica TaxID=869719 RepID=A0A7X0JAG1_9SPHN|nr:alpha/beta hydrolase [Sphingomonas endophytica]MBB6504025.1 pimeloyl-ACP methyl ester carboxylesterase [Sphingomonas endophytica]